MNLLDVLETEAERTQQRRAEGVYGTANAEWWPVVEPYELLWLVAEVRRLRAENRRLVPDHPELDADDDPGCQGE